jgi:cytochrome b561
VHAFCGRRPGDAWPLLPPIVPSKPAFDAGLRDAHRDCAYLLFLTFLADLGAALFHGLIRRDGVFSSMLGTQTSKA